MAKSNVPTRNGSKVLLKDRAQTLHLVSVTSNDARARLFTVCAPVEGEEPHQLSLVGTQARDLPCEPLVYVGPLLGCASTKLAALVMLDRGNMRRLIFLVLLHAASYIFSKVLKDSTTLKDGKILVAMINETWNTAIGVDL